METSSGKKGKKAGWHLTLKPKDAIFAGIGVLGLMMMSFAIGVLAGRGDIYRAAYSWGLMSPEGTRTAQWTLAPGPAAVVPPMAPGAAATPKTAATAARASRGPATVASKPPASVTGSIVPLPSASAPAVTTKKKGKTSHRHRDRQSREEELRHVRREVVQKLKFQNSFDTSPRPRLPKSKGHEKAQAKSGLAKSSSTQVRVGQYRTNRAAEAKVAELHKKGIKATLKKTRDSKGTWYVVYKTTQTSRSAPEKLARKSKKSSGAATRHPKVD